MFSRRFIFQSVLFGLLSVYGGSSFAQSTDFTQNASEALTAEVLINTLYARTAAEKKYCENVIAARNAKILPDRILYSAYRYAMQKDKSRRFTYFQITLTNLCKEAGITLPTATTSTKTSFNPFSFFLSPFK